MTGKINVPIVSPHFSLDQDLFIKNQTDTSNSREQLFKVMLSGLPTFAAKLQTSGGKSNKFNSIPSRKHFETKVNKTLSQEEDLMVVLVPAQDLVQVTSKCQSLLYLLALQMETKLIQNPSHKGSAYNS